MDFTHVEGTLQHISEKPWSDYSEADYSLEQWHSACLIHQHTGPPTSKSQCKLPVKTPNGALNRNGVHAAAAALAGARGGVHAASNEKASAARALVRYYGQLSEDPPESVLSLAHGISEADLRAELFLAHHGVKGMKWGVRKAPKNKIQRNRERTVFAKAPVTLTEADLKKRIARMEMEKRYNDLNSRDVGEGEKLAHRILKGSGEVVVGTLLSGVGLFVAKKVIEKHIGPEAAKGILPKVKGLEKVAKEAKKHL
jgi:hypothetical protein